MNTLCHMYLSLSIHQVRGICLLPYSEFTCVSKFLFLKLVWVRFLSLWPKLSWYCIRESHYPTLKLFIYKMVILSVNLDSKLVERKRQYYLTYRGILKYSRSQDGWLGGSSLDAGTPMSSLCGAQGSVLGASSSAQSKTVRCFHLHQVPRKFCPRAQETSLRSPAQQTSPHSSLARLGSMPIRESVGGGSRHPDWGVGSASPEANGLVGMALESEEKSSRKRMLGQDHGVSSRR